MSTFTETFSFLKNIKTKSAFGGSSVFSKSNPKTARPISTKDAMHVVLKSESVATHKSLNFVRHETVIIQIVNKMAAKLGVQVKDVVVMSNHVHLLLKFRARRSFRAFVSGVSGMLARKILGAERGKKSDSKLFVGRPFSRIVNMARRSYLAIKRYFDLNRLERRGYSKRVSRELNLVWNPPIVTRRACSLC